MGRRGFVTELVLGGRSMGFSPCRPPRLSLQGEPLAEADGCRCCALVVMFFFTTNDTNHTNASCERDVVAELRQQVAAGLSPQNNVTNTHTKPQNNGNDQHETPSPSWCSVVVAWASARVANRVQALHRRPVSGS